MKISLLKEWNSHSWKSEMGEISLLLQWNSLFLSETFFTLRRSELFTLLHLQSKFYSQCNFFDNNPRPINRHLVRGGGAEALSESSRCNDMVADLHFPRCTGIICEIARRFPRSVVKVGPHVQCKNISISSGVQPWTSTDLKLSYFNT